MVSIPKRSTRESRRRASRSVHFMYLQTGMRWTDGRPTDAEPTFHQSTHALIGFHLSPCATEPSD